VVRAAPAAGGSPVAGAGKESGPACTERVRPGEVWVGHWCLEHWCPVLSPLPPAINSSEVASENIYNEGKKECSLDRL
jgi:hypothetical protein